MKDTKHIRQDFHSVTLVIPQGWDFWAPGVPRGQFFFKHGHVAYQIDRDDKQNKIQEKNHPRVKMVTLGEVKSQISLNFGYHDNFNILYQTLCVLSQIKDRKHNFILLPGSYPRGGTWDAGGKKTLVWRFARAPHRLCVIV